MATMEDALRQQVVEQPTREYRVIVRTAGDATPVMERCIQEGMTVHHQYRLLPGLAVTARGAALLALSSDPRVSYIEPDQEVTI